MSVRLGSSWEKSQDESLPINVPPWAKTMLSNYRAEFKEKFDRDWVGSEEELFNLCEKWAASEEDDDITDVMIKNESSEKTE